MNHLLIQLFNKHVLSVSLAPGTMLEKYYHHQLSEHHSKKDRPLLSYPQSHFVAFF